MYGSKLHTALGDAPCRHRTVNAPADQNGRFASSPHRDPACPRNDTAAYIGRKVTDLDGYQMCIRDRYRIEMFFQE